MYSLDSSPVAAAPKPERVDLHMPINVRSASLVVLAGGQRLRAALSLEY